jgi:8-oxo-dGTP diphosphatase
MPISDQGLNHTRYMLVPRTLIVLKKEDKVLLLKGADNKHLWAGLYNGIGGHVEEEEDILSSALRELAEETGLSAPTLYLCGIVTVDTRANPGVGIFIFTGEYPGDQLLISSEGTLEWIELVDVYKLPLVSDLHYLLPKILAFKPGMNPFFAHSKYDDGGDLIIDIR